MLKARKIMISAGCDSACVDSCTASMKEYLTNSCEKCSCHSQKTYVSEPENTNLMVVSPKQMEGQNLN